MKKIATLALTILFATIAKAQHKDHKPPKLVIGIVVDQMRYDYIQRFWDDFSDRGFKRMINKGYFSRNTHYNYVPTYTGPGHASIFTGTTPRYNGIIANTWWDKKQKEMIYCVSDKNQSSIGINGSKAGLASPKNLLAQTFSDELKIFTQFKSKNYSVSLKDRGAILPLGHLGDGAFWYDSESGKMISSTFYYQKSPYWLDKFNDKNLPKKYLQKKWFPLRDYKDLYTGDDNGYEMSLQTGEKATFPYDLSAIFKEKGFGALKSTPHGNTLLVDFGLHLIKTQRLGKDEHPDFLSISFSTPDIIGHGFGTQAWETKDIYLRLDKDIARLLSEVDKYIGTSNVVFFLTADHGGAYNPQFLKDNGSNVEYFDNDKLEEKLKSHLETELGKSGLIENMSNQQIFLNHRTINKNKLNIDIIQNIIKDYLLSFSGIHQVFKSSTLSEGLSNEHTGKLVQNGFQPTRSGDIAYTLNPGWMDYHHKGTTHGSSYTYDTHVPLIWYGWRIKPGESYTKTDITDIVPTLSSFYHFAAPNGGTGRILNIKK
jgi:predicted AlkP superfamily pyrophosphatase or phosphodiesterase